MARLRHALIGVLPPVIAGGIGSISSRNAPEVYERLDKPEWAPPASAFGPVWSGIYGLIGYAGVRMAKTKVSKRVWVLHGTQLVLNAAWSWTFFGIRNKKVSLAVIGSLNAVLAAEIIALARHDRRAAVALIPYIGWTAFATALNASVSEPK